MVAPLVPIVVSTLARAAGSYLAKKGIKKAVKSIARKAVKKRNETPKTGIKSVTTQGNRTIANAYKKDTGRSINADARKFKANNVMKPEPGFPHKGSTQFKRDYKKSKYDPTRGMSEQMENAVRKHFQSKK